MHGGGETGAPLGAGNRHGILAPGNARGRATNDHGYHVAISEVHMQTRSRISSRQRAVPAGCAALVLALFLAGCSLAGGPPSNSTVDAGVIPSGGSPATPPPFPTLTAGAWVKDQSPQAGYSDTLYVIVRVNDPTMAKPSQPPNPPAQVSATITGTGTSFQGQTDSDGFATFQFPANGKPAQPDVINVTVTYNGHTVQTTTFYTVLPPLTTPTPTPKPGK